MGGCRCVFRNCDVYTARNPNMHFFKFPVNEPERLQKWIKFSGAKEILNMKPAQQANRAVCGRHFRDEAFMNYKKDRLCRNQVPTITRISETLAWDFEDLDEDGTPKLVKLEKTKVPHLIAPPNFSCPLGLPLDQEVESTNSSLSPPSSQVSSIRKRSLDQESDSSSQKKKYRAKDVEAKTPERHITNKSCLNKPNIPPIAELLIEINDNVVKIRNDVEEETKSDKAPSNDDLTLSHKALELEHTNLIKEHEELLVAHAELQKKCDILEREVKEKSESKAPIATAASSIPIPQQQLTKSQLFNSIKRYLCSSMTTLVRMEMFSNSEREWKPDERLVSMDLLRLGDNVYKYFLDEWRVRMPPLVNVQQWLSEAANSREIDDAEEEDL